MFDDQLNKNNDIPNNLPVEPDDMFASVDSRVPGAGQMQSAPNALSAGVLKKKDPTTVESQPASSVPSAQGMYEMKQPILGKILLFILVAVIFGGVGFGGWYVYNSMLKNSAAIKPSVKVPANQNQPVVEVQNNIPTTTENIPVETSATTSDVSAKMNNDKILFGQTVDSDKDGLDDQREKELGSNPNKSDTDDDGLNDGDEILIYHTDVLNPDTDGDGYTDGNEVSHGYSPLGAGKLLIGTVSSTTSTVPKK